MLISVLGVMRSLTDAFEFGVVYTSFSKLKVMYSSRNYRLNRTGNICKETEVGKIILGAKADARVVQQKEFIGFSYMSVMANLLRFGCFAVK